MHDPDTNVEAAPLLLPKPKLRWQTVFVLVILVAIINGTSELIWPFISKSQMHQVNMCFDLITIIDPMILELGIAPNKKSIGFYTGLMVCLTSLSL